MRAQSPPRNRNENGGASSASSGVTRWLGVAELRPPLCAPHRRSTGTSDRESYPSSPGGTDSLILSMISTIRLSLANLTRVLCGVADSDKQHMNPLLDITVTVGLLAFLVVGAAVTARTLTFAAVILSSLRQRGSLSIDAKQLGNARIAPRGSIPNSLPGTRPFRGILIHDPNVRIIRGSSSDSNLKPQLST